MTVRVVARSLFALLILLLTAGATAAQDATPTPNEPALTALPAVTARAEGPLKVVTTTPLLADFARQIGGERLDVTSVIPASADPHDFEPSPKEMVAAEEADLIIEHGLHLDEWAADLIANAADAPVVTATAGISTMVSSDEEYSEGDPHVWHDPVNAGLMAANIANALASVDPSGAPDYAARLAAYQTQLSELDAWIRVQIATIPEERRKIVTTHDALGYYIRAYGLTFVGAVIPSMDTRAEPSAKEIADLIALVKSEGVPAIFTEATINPRLEEELAREAGVKVVPNLYADTLGEPGTGADTYTAMMAHNTRLIVEGLR